LATGLSDPLCMKLAAFLDMLCWRRRQRGRVVSWCVWAREL